jgi:adenylate cyclase
MEPTGFNRKLTAILSADVKGYSKLMGDDDESTVNAITTYREIIADLIKHHQGRVVDTPGDNILAEFSGALNAVNSAIEIQQRLAIENGNLPSSRRMEFRIGINLGDVLHKDERIYGDGVNIAARIESLADPGGISISRGVFDQVKKKVRQGFEYMGEHEVKNISEPVRIYRVLLGEEFEGKIIGEPSVGKTKLKKPYAIAIAVLLIFSGGLFWYSYQKQNQIEPASIEKMALPLPEKPSIAVLPFDNMSGDPEQEYFSDGLTEDIITALSKVPDLFVIARNSTFTYKGKQANVKKVAEELGVRYVLEGSVRRAEEKMRITAQLIDALKGDHLWAERYDRTLEDIFSLQDEITMNIVTALQVNLTEGEKIRVLARSTDNLLAYQKYLKGRAYWMRINSDGNAVARQLFEEAIALDPGYSTAYVGLAWTHLMDIHFGVSKSPKESVGQATQLAQRAISLDETSPFAHSLLGSLFAIKRQFEKAIAQGEKSVALSPSDSAAKALLGRTLAYMGKYEEALSWLDKAIRLDPIPLDWYFDMVGHCYLYMGKLEKALEELKKNRNREDISNHIRLAAVYSLLGRKEDASAEAAEILRLNPKFSTKSIERWPYKNKADVDFIITALRKAGLPE